MQLLRSHRQLGSVALLRLLDSNLNLSACPAEERQARALLAAELEKAVERYEAHYGNALFALDLRFAATPVSGPPRDSLPTN